MRILGATAIAVAVAVVGIANAQVEPAPGEPAAPPPTAAPANPMFDAMVAYAAFQSDVSALTSRPVASADDIDGALDRVSGHETTRFVRGWIAYGAEIAAQSPTFVASVRNEAATHGRDYVIATIAENRSYARRLAGGEEATRHVLSAVSADSARILHAADRYQEYAYVLQAQRWANAVAPGQPERLARIQARSQPGATPLAVSIDLAARLSVRPLSIQIGANPNDFGGRRFWDAASGLPVLTEVSSMNAPMRANDTRAEALDRMTSLAALRALDAGGAQAAATDGYLSDPRTQNCMEMARLQLHQCVSAARFVFENAFCIAQHGLRDVGTCIGALAQPDVSAMPVISASAPGEPVALAPLEGQTPIAAAPGEPTPVIPSAPGEPL